MNDIESLLKKARPVGPPADWKDQVLAPARQNRAKDIFIPTRFAWGSLAVCWCLILILRFDTPEVAIPAGTPMVKMPFDRSALLLELCRTEPPAPLRNTPPPDETPPQAFLHQALRRPV